MLCSVEVRHWNVFSVEQYSLPSGCLAIRIPLPPAPDTWNPARKTVKMANPLACCKTFGGTLNIDLVLFPFLSFTLT